MKICTVYFSPTGNTKKSVNTMAGAISQHIARKNGKEPKDAQAFAEYDCTTDMAMKRFTACCNDPERAGTAAGGNGPESSFTVDGRAPIVFESDDFVIFGAPVYAGRIPEVSKARLQNFKGNQTPCILVTSYGNRHYDDALMEMKDMAEQNGFVVKGAAAVIGRHTYGEIQVDRPNAEDLAQMAEFAVRAYENEHPAEKIPGNPVYREGGKGGKFKPSTTDACVKCGLCKRNCPVGAINDDFQVAEQGGCISCFRCIRSCPVKAKVMDTENYLQFAADFTNKLSQRRENEFYL